MKGMVKAIIAGSVFIVIGIIILIAVYSTNDWKIERHYEMKSFTATEIDTLDIDFAVGKLRTEYYDGTEFKVDYPEGKYIYTNCEKIDGRLCVTTESKWHWGINFSLSDVPETKVYIPKGTVLNLKLELNAGSIELAPADYGKVDIEVNAGTLKVNDLSCSAFDCEVSAGTASFGSVADAGNARLRVNAGSMSISKLASSDISAEVNAGSLSTKIAGAKTEYNISAEKNAGSCSVDSQLGTTSKKIKAEVNAGSLSLTFEE